MMAEMMAVMMVGVTVAEKVGLRVAQSVEMMKGAELVARTAVTMVEMMADV